MLLPKEKGILSFISKSSFGGDQRDEKYLIILGTLYCAQCPDKVSVYLLWYP